jgi:RNA polymerase sigma factor (TIGR02999 family)
MGLSSEVVGVDERALVTRLSNDACDGDPHAASELLPLVYEQLKRLARRHMRQERPDHTLQATALVHQAYLQLVQGDDARAFEGRWHFCAAVAEAMRRILVDEARRRSRLKRGGGLRRVDVDPQRLTVDEPSEEMLALDEGLSLLAERHPEKAKLVNLRYFAGLTIEDAAEALGVSVATANRHWAYARAWLFRHLAADPDRAPADPAAAAAAASPGPDVAAAGA